MVGIYNTTRKEILIKSALFVSLALFFYFISVTSAHASEELNALDTFMLGFALGVGGFVAGLGGILFDLAIDNFALQMGDWFINRGVGAVVTSIWTMIRDLFNILFIFTLVYIGLRTILNSEDSGTKKMLGMLIAAALLINFSLYIAKVVVDVSNFTTVQIYETATKGIAGQFGITIKIEKSVTSFLGAEKSISGAYMQILSVSSWFGEEVGSTGNVFVYSVLSLFFLLFLGLVLAYGAVMLIARFIAIIFYLMFSPFMFLGWILPKFQPYATKWWKGFIGYCFFAPVYVFMLYIGLYSLQQIKNGLNIATNDSYAKPFTTNGTFTIGNFEIFLLFAVGVGFLVGATKVASIMSQGGAAIGMNMAHKMSAKIGGAATVGLAARAGRNTAGWAGQRIADNEKVKDWASKSSVGRGVLRSSRAVGNASFDARNVGSVGEKIGIGGGVKGGYKTQKDAIEKKEKEFAKSLGTLDDSDAAVHTMMEEEKVMEVKLSNLKIAKQRADTDKAKAAVAEEIRTVENDIKAQGIKIKREKNRRQIGSSGDIAELEAEQKKQTETKAELKILRTGFGDLSKAEKKTTNEKITALKKDLKKIDADVKKKSGSMGYAGALENRGVIASAIYGRINQQDTSAGKAIRKQYEKDVKKSKEDERADGIKDAVSKDSK